MTELLEIPGTLPNGTEIHKGDIVKVNYGPYTTFTRIIIENEKLCLEDHFLYGKGVPVAHIISQGATVTKSSLVQIYKFCKEHENWRFSYFTNKFAKPVA